MQLYFSPVPARSRPTSRCAKPACPSTSSADTKTKKLEDGSDYFAVNSKGAVPALRLDDGQVSPKARRSCSTSRTRSPSRSWRRRRHARALSPAGVAEFHHQRDAQELLAAVQSAADPKVKEYTTQNLEKRFDWLNTQLAGKQFLTGDSSRSPTPTCSWWSTGRNFVGIDLGRWPALKAFQARVAARPKVQEAWPPRACRRRPPRTGRPVVASTMPATTAAIPRAREIAPRRRRQFLRPAPAP
jgi:glutathione S-transferase